MLHYLAALTIVAGITFGLVLTVFTISDMRNTRAARRQACMRRHPSTLGRRAA